MFFEKKTEVRLQLNRKLTSVFFIFFSNPQAIWGLSSWGRVNLLDPGFRSIHEKQNGGRKWTFPIMHCFSKKKQRLLDLFSLPKWSREGGGGTFSFFPERLLNFRLVVVCRKKRKRILRAVLRWCRWVVDRAFIENLILKNLLKSPGAKSPRY